MLVAASAEDARGDAGERLVMPFSCAKAGGRVTVQPSEPRYYDIESPREVRTAKLCPEQGPLGRAGEDSAAEAGGCAAVIEVQAFNVLCDGGSVAWREIAAVAFPLLGGGARLSGPRLQLQFRGRLRPWAASPCLHGAWPLTEFPGQPVDPRFPNVGCEAFGAFDADEASFNVEGGFAPVAAVGARITERPMISRPDPTLVAPPVPNPGRVRLAGMALASASIGDGGAGRGPTPSLHSVSAPGRQWSGSVAAAEQDQNDNQPLLSQREISDRWLTVVEVVRGVPHDPVWSGERIVLGLILIASLTAGLLSGIGWWWGARSRAPFRPVDAYEVILRRDGVDLDMPDAQVCGDLCRSAQRLIGELHVAIEELKGAAPLRHTLNREVRDIEKFLATLFEAGPQSTKEWRRLRLKLQRVINDVLRLKDIVDAAHRSLVATTWSAGLPRDRDEAFDVLGANATTSSKILKKLVDALRATWHPDLAVDEEDRQRREERIKQINVAWELISKHPEAQATEADRRAA